MENNDKSLKKLHEVAKTYLDQGHRRGQAYFNAAHKVDPKWADTKRATLDDPFHHDERLPKFINEWYKDHH